MADKLSSEDLLFLEKNRWAQENVLTDAEPKIMMSHAPFGKYEGTILHDIPLRYLFETIVDTRPSLFRNAVEFVLSRDWFLAESIRLSNDRFQYRGEVTWMEVYSSYLDRACPIKSLSDEETERARARHDTEG